MTCSELCTQSLSINVLYFLDLACSGNLVELDMFYSLLHFGVVTTSKGSVRGKYPKSVSSFVFLCAFPIENVIFSLEVTVVGTAAFILLLGKAPL